MKVCEDLELALNGFCSTFMIRWRPRLDQPNICRLNRKFPLPSDHIRPCLILNIRHAVILLIEIVDV